MRSKFRFSLDGVDATARQFAEVRRQLQELPASVGATVGRLGERVSDVENAVASLADSQVENAVDCADIVVVPAHGGTGVRNVADNPVSSTHARPVYCFHDGMLGVDGSTARSVVDSCDADGFVPVDALRAVKWKVYRFDDDVNSEFDDAQPTVGLLAEDLDEAGLGFFCEYDDDGNVTGVDYPKLSVAALRLAQEGLDEVEGLKAEVGRLSSEIDRMRKDHIGNSTVGE